MKFALYLGRRSALSLLAVAGAVCLIFFITHVLPGNPLLARVTLAGPDAVHKIEQQLGLDRPLSTQFVEYVKRLGHGDLGTSDISGRSVGQDLKERAPASLELALVATLLALLVSVPLGVYAAVRQGTLVDRAAQAISSLAVSMPAFWIGILLIYVFFYRTGLAAAPLGRLNVDTEAPGNITGFLTVDSLVHGNWAALKDALGHLALPAVTLAITVTAPLVRITRATMLEVLTQPYITCGRALGLSEREVVLRDALRNSLVSVITVAGLVFGYLVSGSVLVEQVFAWPGIGAYAFDALVNNDFAAIQGFVLVVAVTYVGINWLVDALYGVIDPRVRV